MKISIIFIKCVGISLFILSLTQACISQGSSNEVVVSSTRIRPFSVHVADADIIDLRKRIAITRWPDRETVEDASQGVQLARIRSLVDYWENCYDWRKAEAKLNKLPQFVTNIDGVDIHFIHVRSKHKNSLPVIITHGWPGSVFELIKIIEPLTDPAKYGGESGDAFDVVIPSMPGYGFSGRPVDKGWNPERIAKAWRILMERLGYEHYVAQGGDWGAVVANAMGREGAKEVAGIHLTMPATVPPEIAVLLKSGKPAPPELTAKEKKAYESMHNLYTKGGAYAGIMVTRPQTLSYGLTDSPVGLAAFFYDKLNDWTYSNGDAEQVLTKDEILDDITLYWLTNTAASSARLYWENNNNNFNAADQRTTEVKVPVAITIFPGEIYQAPRSWAQRAFPKLFYFNEVDKGGHFAAWEAPDVFVSELRAAFKNLR